MVGVSNPIFHGDRRAGRRFLAGFGAGLAFAAAMLTGPLLALAAVAGLVNETVRVVLLVAVVLGLGLADLCGRTPQPRRQVPQRFARELAGQPGRLGLVWAADLGLLVTTQKTTSLLWIGLAGAVLVGPPAAPAAVLATAAAAYWLGVALLTLTGDRLTSLDRLVTVLGSLATATRRLAGIAAVGVAAALVVTMP